MGRKIELTLLALIVVVGLISTFIKVDNTKSYSKNSDKKSNEILNFTEYEINQTSLIHTLKGKSAQEFKDVWKLKEPNFSNDKITKLTSKESIVTKDKMIFTNKVNVIKKDGVVYNSNKAIYNTKTKELTTPNEFTITRNVDIVKGKKLFYDAKTKITKAKDVNGTFKLKKKDNNLSNRVKWAKF